MSLISSVVKEKLNQNRINFSNLQILAGDASNRKYFLIEQKKTTNVLMYDDGLKTNIQRFLKATNLFKNLGISVPKILSRFEDSGLLIIENFGEKKYSKFITKENRTKLYKIAIDSLIFLHKQPVNDLFEIYDDNIFLEESMLFFNWYLKLKKKKVDMAIISEFKKYILDLLSVRKQLPLVYVHRDFHVDNLFFLPQRRGFKKCGWIDYQDTLVGSPVYDIMSLIEDARIDVNKEMTKYLLKYFLKKSDVIDHQSFNDSFRAIAIQRHLKVLGIFARLYLRDQKPNYLKFIPRVLEMINQNLMSEKYKELRCLINDFL